MGNLQSDEIAKHVLEQAKKFDITAHEKPWNGKRQRHLADLHYGSSTQPAIENRSEITAAKDKIYWWIGYNSPLYKKYSRIIEEIADKEWGERHKGQETRIVFETVEQFDLFVAECFGNVNDINIAIPPKAMSADGFVVICPRCEGKFQHADRCPECGQLIKYSDR